MTQPSPAADREKAPDEVYCRDCGSIISERAEICPECGVRQQNPGTQASDVLEGGNPFVAALLSALIPGLGQIYNRELERGLAFVAASFVSGLLVLFAVGLVVYPIVWVVAIYDAYTRAEQAYEERTGTTRRGRAQGESTRSEPAPDEPARRNEFDADATAADDEWGAGSRPDEATGTESNDSDRT